MKSVVIRTPREMAAYVSSLNANWRPVVIEPYKPKRSLPQNDMFHGLCRQVAKRAGYGVDDVKDHIKEELGLYEFRDVFGQQRKVYRSSASFNKQEMADAIAGAERLLAFLGDTAS